MTFACISLFCIGRVPVIVKTRLPVSIAAAIVTLIAIVVFVIGMDTVFAVLSSVFFSIVTAFVSIVFAIYLLMGKDRLGGNLIV